MSHVDKSLAPILALALLIAGLAANFSAAGSIGQTVVVIGAGAIGPLLVCARSWRGLTARVVISALTWTLVLILFLFTLPASEHGLDLVTKSGIGTLLGGLGSIALSKRGDCGRCGTPISIWQPSSVCVSHHLWMRGPSNDNAHNNDVIFHNYCVMGIEDSLFQDDGKLEHLIALSRRTVPAGEFLKNKGSKRCLECWAELAGAHLYDLCVHSSFLVPMVEIKEAKRACTRCERPAPVSSTDSSEFEVRNSSEWRQSFEMYQLGPLIHCPHCSTMAHYTCWVEYGGCINHAQSVEGKTCSMGGRPKKVPMYLSRGWKELCAHHARRSGWSTEGARGHAPLSLPLAPQWDLGDEGPDRV